MDPEQPEAKNSTIYDLFQWFKNMILGQDIPSPTPAVKPPPPKKSKEEAQKDFDRQVRLLLFEPVPLSEFKAQMERQKGGAAENPDRQDSKLQEAERRQRRQDHEQLHHLVDACLQLRNGHQLMQELWMQSRQKRLREANKR